MRVALTFDAEHPDRPAPAGNAEALLAVLARRGVRATFFVQGRWAEAYPATARSIADGGHRFGHHSHYHARLPLLTDAGIADDVHDGAAAILEATGADPAPWFRCPFGTGGDDPRVLAGIAAAGYRHVGWHVAVDDWDPGHSSAFVTDGVLRGVDAHGDARCDRADPRRTRGRGRRAVPHRRVARRPGERPVTVDRAGPAILAVDGGNSKTDVALVAADGRLLAALRGPTTSHQQVGLEIGADRLAGLV